MGELQTIIAFLSHNNKHKSQISKQEEEIRRNINLQYIQGTSKKLQLMLISQNTKDQVATEVNATLPLKITDLITLAAIVSSLSFITSLQS